ncbi:MAG: hypothetical protein JHC61_09245 [Burkholderiaceae bacterium]|nr:hypothetical protein [Burkholderiaceae bacterium]
MFNSMLSRLATAIAIGIVVSGCSWGGGGDDAVKRSSECKWSRSACMYEGSYELDEEQFAEKEARRLNKAASARLRRSSGR